MNAIASILTALVALSHLGFLVLEMFFWDHPVGRRIFGMTPEVSASSAVLAANQGLYNGGSAGAQGLLSRLRRRRRRLRGHAGEAIDPVHASLAGRGRAGSRAPRLAT